jgi:hypothetical protein
MNNPKLEEREKPQNKKNRNNNRPLRNNNKQTKKQREYDSAEHYNMRIEGGKQRSYASSMGAFLLHNILKHPILCSKLPWPIV